MAKPTVAMLITGDGLKGRTVVSHLVRDERFTEDYDLSLIVDEVGKATETLDRLGVTWVRANDARNPSQAVRAATGNGDPDYLVACGWGYKIPQNVIDAADEAAINCHSSYLPRYKGVSVYRPQWAHAERYGGATVHLLTDEFDDGDIITQARFSIGLFDTPLAIAHKYSDITAPLLREALELLRAGYEGRSQTGGQYYSTVPWTTTLKHGIVNHVLRAVGSDARWGIEPERGVSPVRSNF